MHADLSDAIGRLDAAISDDATVEPTLETLRRSPGTQHDSRNRLPQRAWPFLDIMTREARRNDTDVIWGDLDLWPTRRHCAFRHWRFGRSHVQCRRRGAALSVVCLSSA
ncbi:DUF1840 family protein [Paraburkholderia tropica]|uniref:DUF1840 family protein n=1 Tax=Paraburkholderia tropica TaxID=92647 RepID=UPI002AB6912B|nr:DUF1840 family protein [Paraburkholderia tropica]